MQLDFTECNCAGTGLFEDFVRYKSVDQYLQAIVDVIEDRIEYLGPNCPKFIPLDCAVTDPRTGISQWIIRASEVDPDAERFIKWLRRQPARIRHFMSDRIVIHGDWFERELYIKWK